MEHIGPTTEQQPSEVLLEQLTISAEGLKEVLRLAASYEAMGDVAGVKLAGPKLNSLEREIISDDADFWTSQLQTINLVLAKLFPNGEYKMIEVPSVDDEAVVVSARNRPL